MNDAGLRVQQVEAPAGNEHYRPYPEYTSVQIVKNHTICMTPNCCDVGCPPLSDCGCSPLSRHSHSLIPSHNASFFFWVPAPTLELNYVGRSSSVLLSLCAVPGKRSEPPARPFCTNRRLRSPVAPPRTQRRTSARSERLLLPVRHPCLPPRPTLTILPKR